MKGVKKCIYREMISNVKYYIDKFYSVYFHTSKLKFSTDVCIPSNVSGHMYIIDKEIFNLAFRIYLYFILFDWVI